MRLNSAFPSLAMPRAVIAAPRANSDPRETIAQIQAAVTNFTARHDERLDQIEAAVNQMGASHAAFMMSPGSEVLPEDPHYTGLFASYVRNGDGDFDLRKLNSEGQRAQVQAAMNVGTDSAGGYLAPVEWDRKVHQAQLTISPMRRICTVVQTSAGAYSTVWNDNSWGSGWVGETAARPGTTNPTLSSLDFATGEIYANPAITQRLLDDAAFNVESWLSDQLAAEFSKQEGVAFLSGNGTNKPFGFLTYVTGAAADARHPGGNLGITNSGHATTIPNTDILVDFSYSLTAPYRQGAVWLMNSSTAASIAKMKDGDGNYIWREAFLAGQPATLLGYPVEIDEGMPAIGAGNLAVAFGNFKRGYLINDRTGIRTLRDPYTNKPYVNFYTTKRVAGGVIDPNAIRLLKISA